VTIAEVECPCPSCHRVVAQLAEDDGALVVRYRSAGIKDRPDRVVEQRTWQTSVVPSEDSNTVLAYWESTCKDVRCQGRFVLDLRRVRQLAGKCRPGSVLRWQPQEADVERSERLRPILHMATLPEPINDLRRLALSDPPPLVNVRTKRVDPSP
jgi:hypothetical protein